MLYYSTIVASFWNVSQEEEEQQQEQQQLLNLKTAMLAVKTYYLLFQIRCLYGILCFIFRICTYSVLYMNIFDEPKKARK